MTTFQQSSTSSTRVASAAIVVLVAVSVGLTVWLGFSELGPAWGAAIGVAAAAFLAWMTSFALAAPTMAIGGRSVRISYGWSFRREIPLDRIEDVAVVDFRPLRDLGGWGIRRSAALGKVVVKGRGQGVSVLETDGRRTTVALDDPSAAADALTGRCRGPERTAPPDA